MTTCRPHNILDVLIAFFSLPLMLERRHLHRIFCLVWSFWNIKNKSFGLCCSENKLFDVENSFSLVHLNDWMLSCRDTNNCPSMSAAKHLLMLYLDRFYLFFLNSSNVNILVGKKHTKTFVLRSNLKQTSTSSTRIPWNFQWMDLSLPLYGETLSN